MKKFNELFPVVDTATNGSMYRLLPWRGIYLYNDYDERMKAMSSVWALAFANFVASHMELEPKS